MTMIAILGDSDTTGQPTANITSVSPLVTYTGVPVPVVGGPTATESHYHGDNQYPATPLKGSTTVRINGLPVHRVGDQRSCGVPGHVTVTTQPRTVNIFT